MIDQVPMEDRDTKGDLYEYMLGKIATAGQNGQFRTPRRIIQLMVELTAPTPTDVGRGSEAGGDHLDARRRVQAVCGSLDGDRVVHQDQLGRHRACLVLRHAGRWQVAGRQANRVVATAEARPDTDGEADVGRARQEQLVRHCRPVAKVKSAAGR